MTPRTRSRLARTVTLSVLALAPVAGALPGSLAADAPRGTSETPSRLAPAQAARATADVELPRTVRGETAVRLLGEQVDEAAALNGLEADELVDLLREDPAVWLSSQGRAYYRDPAPEHAAGGAPLAAPDLAAADTFQLHSSPGSTRKIFLDFDGATVGSGWWKEDHPELDTSHPAWDPAGDGPAFSDGERSQVKAIWPPSRGLRPLRRRRDHRGPGTRRDPADQRQRPPVRRPRPGQPEHRPGHHLRRRVRRYRVGRRVRQARRRLGRRRQRVRRGDAGLGVPSGAPPRSEEHRRGALPRGRDTTSLRPRRQRLPGIRPGSRRLGADHGGRLRGARSQWSKGDYGVPTTSRTTSRS